MLKASGVIEYYKDEVLLKGWIIISKNTKVIKTGRDRFEIHTGHRIY